MSRFFWSTDNTRQTGNPGPRSEGEISGVQEFISAIYPHVMRRGWRDGLKDHYRTQLCETMQMRSGFTPSWFAPRQGVWKLLLPGNFTTDLFVADASLGAIPIDLSKSYARVIVHPWYDRSADLIRKRALEAGASNVHVCDSIDDQVLKDLGCSFGISLMVVTRDLVSTLGEQGVENRIARILDCVSRFSTRTWTNVFVFPNRHGRIASRCFPSYFSPTGMTAAGLKRTGAPHGLTHAETHHLKGLPENITEVDMKAFRDSPAGAVFPAHGLRLRPGDIGRAIRSRASFSQSQAMILERGGKQPSWLHGFLSHLQAEGFGRPTVRRCLAGKPNTALLELVHDTGYSSVCRMPLGKGEITDNRAENNYTALQRLESCGELSMLVPRPLCRGVYQGQKYYMETFLSGRKHSLVSENHARIFKMIRPALIWLYLDAGRDTHIDGLVYHNLAGDGISMLKRYARGREDLRRIQDLDRMLKDILLDTEDRLPQIHGDFKIENMLFGRRGLRGIIDWDLSAAFGPPYLDLLYFYAYSFHHSPHTNGGGIMGFIINRLLRADPGPVLESWIEEYTSCLGVSPVWLNISGILFWLHYVTRIMGTALPAYDPGTYRENIREPLAVIAEKMQRFS
ncbi:MAG TPA: phosphotransferase [Deltaproteobacteria bacterium]|nr:phosphotransferase [Deltaproteobacteria bacterium]